MKDLPDDELMLLYRDGDEAAFHALFDRHRRLVYHFARVMLNDAGLAEDIMQEAFLAVARAAGRYEAKGTFRTWLLRIVRNRCLNALESRRVRRAIFAETGIEFLSPAELAAPDPSASEHAQALERLSLVDQAIQALPDRQREALVLHAFDSMSYLDIAQVLDVPPNTVKTLIHRARAALARALDDAGEDVP